MPTVLHPDPFNAVLFNSPPLVVSVEQQEVIHTILDRACSDSKFADKAYAAISLVLKGNNVRPPTVTSLVPNTVEIGDPSVTLHVHGTNFSAASKIIFNGFEEPTTLVSATEVTTGINMDVWLAPAVVPVVVSNGNVQSDPLNFTFTDGLAGQSLSLSPQAEKVLANKVVEAKKEAVVKNVIGDK